MAKNEKESAFEESIEYELIEKGLLFRSQNISEIKVRLYEINVEILFSKQPFKLKDITLYSYVKPNHEEIL